MPGNSQRKGAVRKRGKGVGASGNTAGSGGRVRQGLEGKGPTPKAEDRPYHKSYRKRRPDASPISDGKGARKTAGASRSPQSVTVGGAEWVVGRNPVFEALEAGLPVKKFLVAEGIERDSRLADILRLAAEQGVPIMQASRRELDNLTSGAIHQGVALQVPEFEYTHPTDLLGEVLDAAAAPLVVACDSITDPRNLGAIIRSAVAFGATGVILPERRSAHVTAAVWKTSAGALSRVPVALATNLNRVLSEYAAAGFVVVGLAGEADVDIADVPGIDGPVLLVVGSEGSGLARLTRSTCDVIASIPIGDAVESLNASVAASIALYQVTRSRHALAG